MVLRVGVIGTGFGAQVHVPVFALLPETEPTALCGRSLPRTRAVAGQFGVPHAFDDYRDLIACDAVDAVSIAAPPELHHPIALAALAAGKPVLCEKPLARTLVEAREMERTATAAGVVAMLAHVWRYIPARALLKELVASGYLGAVTLAQVSYARDLPRDARHEATEADAGGVLLALAPHHADALRWWCGEVAAVAGVATPETVVATLRFASGATGALTISVAAPHGPGEEVRLFGTEGMLALTPDGTLWGATRADAAPDPLPIPARLLGSGVAAVDAVALSDPQAHPLIAPFARLARLWAAAIADRAESPAPNFTDGLRVQEILDGIARSGEQRKWIDLSGNRWQVPPR